MNDFKLRFKNYFLPSEEYRKTSYCDNNKARSLKFT